MTTFVPPELIRSTGDLTVEKVIVSPLTGAATEVDYNTDKSAGLIAGTSYIGHDSGGNDTIYGRIEVDIVDATDTTEDGSITIQTMQAGTLTDVAVAALGLTMNGATGGDQGNGTINATALYVNGVAVSTSTGDVVGPGSATDNAIARFDATTGKLIQNSGVLIDDSNNITGVNNLTVTGDLTVNGTTTTVNTATLSVEDSLIQVGNANNATDTIDLGIVGLYDTSGTQDLYAGIFRDATDNKWKIFVDSQEDLSTASTVNTAAVGYTVGTLVANLEGNVTGQVSDLSNHDTDDLAEGVTNLYYTDERVDDRAAALIQNGTGISWVYDDGLGTLTPTVSLASFDTDDLAEGATNKYASTANVDAAGAVMEADFNAFTILAADTDNTPAALTVGASTFVGRLSTGGIVAATPAQVRTELNVSDGANASSIDITTYTAGVDYTAGVTDQLTLSSTPAGEANIMVFFEGVWQSSTEWSFATTTLTFTSPIPTGVNQVEIRIITNA